MKCFSNRENHKNSGIKEAAIWLLPLLGMVFLLWYIKNAKCLLTDSFHGTCFAINFGTQFIEILPGRFNARNQSLLKAMGVEDRILMDYHDFSLYEKKIEWGKVDAIHNAKREQSIEILKEMIEGEEE